MAGDAFNSLLHMLLCLAILDGGGQLPKVSAVTCPVEFDHYCPSTSPFNGTCGSDGNCTCISGYFPERFGCHKDLEVPVISLQDDGCLPYGINGSQFILVCSPHDQGSGNYVWRKEGIDVGENDSILTVNLNIEDSPHGYTCQYQSGSLFSSQSATFQINIIELATIDDTDPAIQTSIQGMPNTILNGTSVTLTAAPVMKASTSYQWTHSFPTVMEMGNTLFITQITTEYDNSDIHIEVTYMDDSATVTTFGGLVVPSISDNIPTVSIAGGDKFVPADGTLALSCVFDDETFISSGFTITWEWFVNGTKRDTLTSQEETLVNIDSSTDHGLWQCAAQFESQPQRLSPSVFVYTDFDYTISLTRFPGIAVLDGLLELTCEVESSVDVNFTYSWIKDMSPISHYDDRTLYLNNLGSSDEGRYTCNVSIGDLEKSDGVNIIILEYDVLVAPRFTINNTGGVYEFQEFYQITCTTHEHVQIPGYQVSFLANGRPVQTGFEETLIITGNIFDLSYQCRVEFNGYSITNGFERVSFEVLGGVLIKDIDNTNITAIDAVVNTVINLHCEVTVREGVMEEPSVAWYNESDVVIGTEMTLALNVTHMGERFYYCIGDLGSHNERSAENVNVTGHVLSAPILGMVGGGTGEDLDFTQTHRLHCDVGGIIMLFDIRYTFQKDGVDVLTNSSSDTYTIINDIYDRAYTCMALYQTVTSPASENVNVSFAVFDTLEIKDVAGNDISSINGIVGTSVILVADVTLLPDVSGDVTITWFDQALTEVGMDINQMVPVTAKVNTDYFFEAELGSHHQRSENVTVIGNILGTPMLSIQNNLNGDILNFSNTYNLHCDVGTLLSAFDLQYEYSRDGTIVHTSASDTYTISNDVIDREYTCRASFMTVNSSISNSINTSFEVFDTLEVQDGDGDDVTYVDAIIDAPVSLSAVANLLDGVPGLATITWYDDESTQLATGSTLVVVVQEGRNISYFFDADLGSHTQRSHNVTVIGYALETPELIFVDGIDGVNLSFAESYSLQCVVNDILSTFALEFQYLRDGTVIATDSSDTYEISNDVTDREYACRLSYFTATSQISNSINTSFEVFDELNISDSLRCHVRSEVEPTFLATLTCGISLLPGVPGQISYTWHDADGSDIGSASTYDLYVTNYINTSVTCRAEIGSHVESFTLDFELSTVNITIPCSASTVQLSMALFAFVLGLTYCHLAHCS